jgi:hypothetical protein
MFEYDDSHLLNVVWKEFVQLKEENVRLKASLEVATKVAEALNTQLQDVSVPTEPISE